MAVPWTWSTSATSTTSAPPSPAADDLHLVPSAEIRSIAPPWRYRRRARAAGAASTTWDSVVSRRIQAHRSKISTNEAQWYYPTDGPFT